MTTWVDWHNWTHFVVGQEIVYGGRVSELDFASRRIIYERDTGNSFDENPHPHGTEEARRFLYETVEATFDRVWVDPDKKSLLDVAASRALEAGEKPASYIELDGVDPRDYFAGQVEIMSTYAPSLARLMHPEIAAKEEQSEVEEPRDRSQALDAFRQLQRDIAEGMCPLAEAVAQCIWYLGAVEDIGAAWNELDPWIGIHVRSMLRDRPEGMKPQMAEAWSRVASWADQNEVLTRDRAFAFMQQPPAELLEWVRLNLGEALPDPGMSWRGVADDALARAYENPAGHPWLSIAIEIFGWLASQAPDPDNSVPRVSEMYARVHRIRLPSTSLADREADRETILRWFFRHESTAPSEAAICDRDWYKLTKEQRREHSRIRRKLQVLDFLYESRESVPARIGEWLKILPHLR